MDGRAINTLTATQQTNATSLGFVTNIPTEQNSTATINYFSMPTAPSGWLVADGSEVSRTTYSDLFSLIGTTYGAGNGSTTFNLPDLRGEFIRGWDNGRNVDISSTFGSSQLDALENFTGTLDLFRGGQNWSNQTNGIFRYQNVGSGDNKLANAGHAGQGAGIITIDASRQARTSTETRPRNIAMLPCIKAFKIGREFIYLGE